MAVVGVIAGCSTAPKRETYVVPLVEPATNAVVTVTPPVAPPEPPPKPPAPAPTTPVFFANLQSVRNKYPTLPWLPYESWYSLNGTTVPEQARRNTLSSLEYRTTNGIMSIVPGHRVANWNGLGIWLGYAPQYIQGHLHLHVVDLEKSLFPLLCDPDAGLSTNAVVLLDPGHGGKDPGTKSVVENRYEKEFTLDWGLRIQRLMSAKGWKVYLTRTNDTDLTIPDRVALAERLHAELFVSLHFNTAPGSPDAAGLETYCLTPVGMPSSVTRGYGDDQRQGFPNNAFDAQNLEYAVRLHQALLAVNGQDRTVRRARFLGVLRGQNRPAVLVEGGYLSNPKEARRIADPRYRQELSQAVVRALLEHRRVTPVPTQVAERGTGNRTAAAAETQRIPASAQLGIVTLPGARIAGH